MNMFKSGPQRPKKSKTETVDTPTLPLSTIDAVALPTERISYGEYGNEGMLVLSLDALISTIKRENHIKDSTIYKDMQRAIELSIKSKTNTDKANLNKEEVIEAHQLLVKYEAKPIDQIKSQKKDIIQLAPKILSIINIANNGITNNGITNIKPKN
jgi:hypothetical protein